MACRFERSEPAFAPTKFEVPDLPQRKDDNVLTVGNHARGREFVPPMVPITDGHRERSSKEESHGNHEDARSTTV